jgi:hypothetical protein
MSVHKSGDVITANGSYEFTVFPGRSYLLEPFYNAGTGTITVFSGIEGLNYDAYQATQAPIPGTPTDISIAKTTTIRAYKIYATGNRIRLTVASASSLVLIPMLSLIPHGS